MYFAFLGTYTADLVVTSVVGFFVWWYQDADAHGWATVAYAVFCVYVTPRPAGVATRVRD